MVGPPAAGLLTGMEGLHTAVVKKLDGDPAEECRIQVELPWLEGDSKLRWARLSTLYDAGGSGAFIDQMAPLLDVSVDELDRLSLEAEKIYPIASRCGVFAKTDIQPLLNQGAKKSDLAMSIYTAVVNQTIAGLAQGKRIRG